MFLLLPALSYHSGFLRKNKIPNDRGNRKGNEILSGNDTLELELLGRKNKCMLSIKHKIDDSVERYKDRSLPKGFTYLWNCYTETFQSSSEVEHHGTERFYVYKLTQKLNA